MTPGPALFCIALAPVCPYTHFVLSLYEIEPGPSREEAF